MFNRLNSLAGNDFTVCWRVATCLFFQPLVTSCGTYCKFFA